MKGIPRWKRLLNLMQHGGWISMRELQEAGGWRYGGRLYDLKQMGWDHDKKVTDTGEYFYRLFRRAPVGTQTRLALNLEQEATS